MKRKSGFTLIELIVVIAIIGILAAIATPRLEKYKIEAQTKAQIASAKSIYQAALAYDTKNKIYLSNGAVIPQYTSYEDGSCVLAPYLDDNVKMLSMSYYIDEPGEFSIEPTLNVEDYTYKHFVYYYDPRVFEVTDGSYMYNTALVDGVPIMAHNFKIDPETGLWKYGTVEEFLESPENFMSYGFQ